MRHFMTFAISGILSVGLASRSDAQFSLSIGNPYAGQGAFVGVPAYNYGNAGYGVGGYSGYGYGNALGYPAYGTGLGYPRNVVGYSNGYAPTYPGGFGGYGYSSGYRGVVAPIGGYGYHGYRGRPVGGYGYGGYGYRRPFGRPFH